MYLRSRGPPAFLVAQRRKRRASQPLCHIPEAGRGELESLSRRGTAPSRMVMRARIVLLAAGGTAKSVIAGRLGIWEDTARKWRLRYCEQGLDRLADAPRPARPRRFPARVVAEVKALAFEDLDELAAQTLAFEKHYNATARPFGWKLTRTDLNHFLARIRQHDRHAPYPLAA
ncbi:MAG: helix-turn-helix domain-containing protein [Streptosporangiaceae bacterium]